MSQIPLTGGNILVLGRLVDENGHPTSVFQRWISDLQNRVIQSLNQQGQVVGVITTGSQQTISTDNIVDGTGLPLAGGKAFETLIATPPANGQVPTWNGTAFVPGTPSGGTITGVTAGTGLTGGGTSGNVTLNLSTPVSIADGGTGTATPSLVAGTNVTITGSWPNQTISASGGGSSYLKGTVVINAGGALSGTFKGTGTVTGAGTTMSVAASAPALINLCGTSPVSVCADVASTDTVEVQVTLPNIGLNWSTVTFYVTVFP